MIITELTAGKKLGIWRENIWGVKMSHWIKETRMKKRYLHLILRKVDVSLVGLKEIFIKEGSVTDTWTPCRWWGWLWKSGEANRSSSSQYRRRKSNLENMRIAELTLNLISNSSRILFFRRKPTEYSMWWESTVLIYRIVFITESYKQNNFQKYFTKKSLKCK